MIRVAVCCLFCLLAALPVAAAPLAPAKAAALLEQGLAGEMAEARVPGLAMAVVSKGETVYAEGFGVTRAGTSERVSAQTLFRIGSTSKAFTSALIAMLADDGVLSFDDPAGRWLPELRFADAQATGTFTLADLMAQHSGLPAYSADALSLLGYSREQIIEAVRHIEPVAPPRTRFTYVNHLWLAAGMAAERAAKRPFAELLHERIFAPLSMDRTSGDLASWLAAANRARPYRLWKGELTPLPENLDWSYTYLPAGGINSTAQDMARWLAFQLGNGETGGKRLVSEAGITRTHAPVTVVAPGKVDEPLFYGLGWVFHAKTPEPMIWHTGGTLGMASMVAMIPGRDAGIVILTNSASHDLHQRLAGRFYDLVTTGVVKDTKPPDHLQAPPDETVASPQSVAAPLPLARYAGDYANPVYGTAEVREAADGLTVVLGPRRETLVLTHLNRDAFLADWELLADEDSLVRFDTNGTHVVRMVLDVLDDDGLGEFTRLR